MNVNSLISVGPNRRGYKMRWKKKALEREKLAALLSTTPQEQYGFKTPEDAANAAERILTDYRHRTELVEEHQFNQSVVRYHIGEALEHGLEESRINRVISNALADAIKLTSESQTPLSDYWSEFWKDHTSGVSPKWSKRNARRWLGMYKQERDIFFALPVSTFGDVATGRDAFRRMFERHSDGWKSHNTARSVVSFIRNYLLWLEGKNPDLINVVVLDAICRLDAVVPKGLKKEQENFAAAPEMAQSLIEWAVKSEWKICGAVILKLFTGARTNLLHQWKWSIVDWDKKAITIPKGQSKLKRTYSFSFDCIPHLEQALRWAWEQDGKPEPQEPIAPCCQPKFTNMKKAWINDHREIFAVIDSHGQMDLHKEIKPIETHKNMERAAFITYGAKLALNADDNGFTRDNVALVAEDEQSWESYRDKKRTYKQAEEYFALMRIENLQKIAR